MSHPPATQSANATDLALFDPADITAAPPLAVAPRLFRPVRIARFACLVGLAVFAPYLVQQLPHLASRPEYRLRTESIQIVPAPEHPVPSDLVDQVRRLNQLPDDLSLLDPKLCPNLAAAFARHPWVSKVNSVRQSFPASVTVQLQYRTPMAMAQVKGGRIPIDGGGIVLPSEDFAPADVPRYPTIRLVGAANLTRAEDRITDPGLPGAARLAQLLAPQWVTLELEAIELPRQRDSGKSADDVVLQIQTKSGSIVTWGRAPGTNHPGELTPPQKLARLEKYHAEFGGFDRPSGPYEIDIRHWQEITRRPVAKAQAMKRETRTRR